MESSASLPEDQNRGARPAGSEPPAKMARSEAPDDDGSCSSKALVDGTVDDEGVQPVLCTLSFVAEDGVDITYNKVESTRPFLTILNKYAKSHHEEHHRCQYTFKVNGKELDEQSSMHHAGMASGTIVNTTFNPDLTYLHVVKADKHTGSNRHSIIYTITTTKTNAFQNAFDVYATAFSVESRFLKFEANGKEVRGNACMSSLKMKHGAKIAVTEIKPLTGFRPGIDYNMNHGGLPDELLGMAMTYLSHMDSRTFMISVPLVCRRWYNVCRLAIDTNLDLSFASCIRSNGLGPVMRNSVTDNGLMMLADLFPLTSSVNLLNATRSCTGSDYKTVYSQLTATGFEYMLTKCKHLAMLDLTGCTGANDKWLKMLGDLTSLEVLKMKGCAVSANGLRALAASKMPLKHFVLPASNEKRERGAAVPPEEDWFSILAKFSELERLDASSASSWRTAEVFGEGFPKFAAGCSRLQSLVLPRRFGNAGLEALEKCSRLTELVVGGKSVTKSVLVAIGSGCLDLNKLEISSPEKKALDAFLTQGFKMPSLKTLLLKNLYHDDAFTDEHGGAIARACEELQSLSLDGGTATGDGMSLMKLTQLCLSSCSQFTGKGTHLPALNDLNARCCNALGLEGLQTLLQPGLVEHLDLSENEQLANPWMRAIGDSCPELQTLKLESIASIDENGMLAVTCLSKLTKLNMRHAKNIKAGPWLDEIMKGCWSKLTSVDFDGSTRVENNRVYGETMLVDGKDVLKVVKVEGFVDDQWIQSFAKGCPLLEEVGVRDNNKITGQAIWDLCDNCPLMQRFDCSECCTLGALSPRFLSKIGSSWKHLTNLEMVGMPMPNYPDRFASLAANCKKLTSIFLNREHQSKHSNDASNALYALVRNKFDARRAERVKKVDPAQLKAIGRNQRTYEEVYPEPEQSIRLAEDKAFDEDPQVIFALKLDEQETSADEALWNATLKLFPPGVVQNRCSCCHYRGQEEPF